MDALPLVTALVAGFVHALEPDHMAAVTTFVAHRPRPREALRFGVRWGLGHSVAILVVGGALSLLGLRMPDGVARGLEFGVGSLLVALGGWLLWTILHERAHALARPKGGAEPAHRHGAGWVGVAHGVAGTGSLVALLQATLAPSPGLAVAYLLCFGVGTTLAMGAYAAVAGVLFRSARGGMAGALRASTAVASAALGVFWMYAALRGGGA